MLHTRTLFCSLSVCVLLVLSTSLHAQETGPAPVCYAYHFQKGQVLHYHLIDKVRDPTVEGCNGYTNYDRHEDAIIHIDSVDANGNATMTVTNDERYDWRGGVDGSKLSQGGRAMDIPSYRVTIDPFGRLLVGEILRRDPKDSVFHEMMKQPNFHGFAAPDTSRIKWTLSNFLPVRKHATASKNISDVWSDTTRIEDHPIHYNLRAPTPASSQEPPQPAAYTITRALYRIAKMDGQNYSLITREDKEQVWADQLTTFHTEATEERRADDGIPVSQDISWSAVKDGKNIFGFTHREIKLEGER